MSPVGDLLRNRCRNFPALVNCCTLDWFDNWPEEALRTVSKQYFREHGLIGDSVVVREILELFPRIHRMVEELSEQFMEEQKRSVYITPKSFLDALQLFKDQSFEKQQQQNRNYNRLKNGIDKLESTNLQIAELKVTLEDLVPKLLTSNESAEKQVATVEE